MKPALPLCALLLLCGCAINTTVSDNEACVVKLDIPNAMTNCLGIYDVVYHYKNPPRPDGPVRYHSLTNPAVLDHYIAQEGTNHFYAAALASTFGILGTSYSQNTFASAISGTCFGSRNAPLTFSQIVFAATHVHAPPGVWYSELSEGTASRLTAATSQHAVPIANVARPASHLQVMSSVQRCQGAQGGASNFWMRSYLDLNALATAAILKQRPAVAQPDMTPPSDLHEVEQLDLYAARTWHYKTSPPGTQDGGIVPVRTSAHLIELFHDGWPIVAGLDHPDGGHVVLVHRITMAVVTTGQDSVTMHPSAHISAVTVSDPALPESRKVVYSGDEFLDRARFLFAVFQLRRTQ